MSQELTEFELYKQIIETVPIHIYWKDKEFRYLACNMLQARSVGLSSPSEIVGKTDYDIFSKKQADQNRKNDMQIVSTGVSGVFEEGGFDDDIGSLIYLTQKVPLYNNLGEIIGVAGISIDITARKKQEDKAREEKERAELTLASILDELPGHVYWLRRAKLPNRVVST